MSAPPAAQRQGFSSTHEREAKALKIQRILSKFGHPITADALVLDIGTGSGEIAEKLAARSSVIAIDRVDQRTCHQRYCFVQADTQLPFSDDSFDIVISNHVIEHVQDPSEHVHEIRRVLKPRGVLYLATPNRWWPWEFHHRMLLIHYLPSAWFRTALQRLGRYREDLTLFPQPSLGRLTRNLFDLYPVHDRVCRKPVAYSLNVPASISRFLEIFPPSIFRYTAYLQPTLIFLLTPRDSKR